jgi:hypothetical protein
VPDPRRVGGERLAVDELAGLLEPVRESFMYCTWAEISSDAHFSMGTSLTEAGAPR